MKYRVSKKIFAHIDCDSFFAECEIHKNPKLKNKYVLVWDEIVIACNYKTKALDIGTGTPVWQAKQILKWQGIFLKGNHRYYSYISDRLMNYLKFNTLHVEPFSIDEAFCEISWLAEMNKMSLQDYTKYLQKDILKKIWVPVSIWVSNTRIKAKIFSKLNKPFWIYISLDSKNDKELFSHLPLEIVPFIWKKTQQKFKYSCENVYDFIKIWYWKLKEKIGKNATDLRLELIWVNAFVVKKSYRVQSMSRWRSFNKNITCNPLFLKNQLLINFNWLYEELIEKELETKVISIFLRDVWFFTHVYTTKLPEYSYIRKHLLDIILELFEKNIDPHTSYRSTGVIFSKLKNSKPHQINIFESKYHWKTNNLQLYQIVNDINKKYQCHKISFWSELLWLQQTSKLGIRK